MCNNFNLQCKSNSKYDKCFNFLIPYSTSAPWEDDRYKLLKYLYNLPEINILLNCLI